MRSFILVNIFIAGWVYLIMQQMDTPLFDAVLEMPVQKSKVDLGSVASRLVTMIKEIHTRNHVLTDVKPDNFMLVPGSGSIVDRVRIIDLGLFKTFRHEHHEPNEGLSEVRGTPLYASLNTHNLQTISRRDDLEALLYLIMDLLIGVHAKHTSQQKKWYKKGSYLPWSAETSDAAVGAMKAAQVDDLQSELYKRMPKTPGTILHECWTRVRTYKYKQAPEYEWFEQKLAAVVVPVAPTQKIAATKKHARPEVSQRRSSRRKTGVASAVHVDSANDDNGTEPMEIDEVWSNNSDQEENLKPAAVNEPPRVKENRKYQAALIVVQKGSNKGQSWILQEGDEEKYVIGSNPSKKGFNPITLRGDSIDSNHAKLQLQLHKQSLRVAVEDLKSRSGTFINSNSVKKSVAFPGHVITIGDTQLVVRHV